MELKSVIPNSQKIRNKVQSSYQKPEQSKLLLEIRKIGGERAPLCKRGYANETDEATATTWINQQIEILGVELT